MKLIELKEIDYLVSVPTEDQINKFIITTQVEMVILEKIGTKKYKCITGQETLNLCQVTQTKPFCKVLNKDQIDVYLDFKTLPNELYYY